MTFDLAHIDRAFYETIRKAVVAKSWLPDNSVLSQAAYLNALETMKQHEDTIVEVFGVSSASLRANVALNKIVIDRVAIQPATIGAYGLVVHERVSSTEYHRKKRPAMTYRLLYQLGYVTDNTTMDRQLHNIFLSELGAKGVLQGIQEDGSKTSNYFDYTHTEYRDNTEAHYFERIFRYEVNNVFLAPAGVEEVGIGVLTDIQLQNKLKSYE